jgi:cellulose synthase/poly-beta-1,6-N-acetylglucosamine synthase-like glycosyltransferase
MISTLHLIIIIAFLSALIIQILYYLVFYRKVLQHILETNIEPEEYIPVSIIIAARNEATRLENLMPVLLHQNYPEFEIIIIDDRSTDGTRLLISRLAKVDTRIRYIKIQEGDNHNQGKKYALTKGIENASYNCLLFTDADCIPVSDMWIARMVSQFKNNNIIVLGYGGYFSENNFVNDLIRYDTDYIAMQYGSFALSGLPYMGVGRNILYSKQLWEKGHGFSSHFDIASGDDDLFVQTHLNDAKFEVQFHAEAATRSIPPETFKEWEKQKIRHYSSSSLYSFKLKIILALEPLSRIALILLFLVGIISLSPIFKIIFVVAYFIRLIIVYIILGMFLKRLNERGILKYLILFDFVVPCVQTYFYICGLFRLKNTTWK